MPDCEVEEGILSAIKPYQPAGFENKLGVWCNNKDIVCGSSLNIMHPLAAHTSYSSNDNAYKKLARIIKERIAASSQSELTTAKYSDAPPRDIVLILHNGQTINGELKNKLVELANHGTRISIYNSYSEIGVGKKYEKEIDFTTDNLSGKIDKLNQKINGLIKTNLSKEYDNTYFLVKHISKNADWQDGYERNIYVLMTDYTGHTYGMDGTTVKDAYEAAKNNNVKVSFIGNTDLQESYFYILDETGGKHLKNLSDLVFSRVKLKSAPTYFSKTFDLGDAKNTLVVINGCLYGMTNEKSITITDLDNTKENEIIFVKYDGSGNREGRKSYIYTVPEEKIKAPDTSGT